jgi:hypothetical protein
MLTQAEKDELVGKMVRVVVNGYKNFGEVKGRLLDFAVIVPWGHDGPSFRFEASWEAVARAVAEDRTLQA